MFLNSHYKIYNVKDFLNDEEYFQLETEVSNFTLDENLLKSNLGFLMWSDQVRDVFKSKHPEDYEILEKTNMLTYDIYKKLATINFENPKFIEERNYFNFFIPYTSEDFHNSKLKTYYQKVYEGILYDLYNKHIKKEYKNTLFGNINVYPKSSFITKHVDSHTDAKRIFTILFFINKDWNKNDGSILRIYDNSHLSIEEWEYKLYKLHKSPIEELIDDKYIDIVPDFNTVVLLEGSEKTPLHEVTINLSEKFRYSLYGPFTDKDYETKLE